MLSSGAVDAHTPPDPHAGPPPYHYAATDTAPRTARENELCERASTTDWAYLAIGPAAVAGSIYLDAFQLKESSEPGIRTIGPGLVGVSWGFTLGGGYLALPKCSSNWVRYAPPEGDVRRSWPLALGLALFSGVTAPILVGVETGPIDFEWSVSERVGRLVTAGLSGFTGALLPYLLPPKTWRAAKELEHLRATADQRGATIGWSIAF